MVIVGVDLIFCSLTFSRLFSDFDVSSLGAVSLISLVVCSLSRNICKIVGDLKSSITPESMFVSIWLMETDFIGALDGFENGPDSGLDSGPDSGPDRGPDRGPDIMPESKSSVSN